MFYSADIGSGERLKQVLYFIRDTYIALAISIVSVKLYLILTESITSFGITGLGKGLVAIFIAYAVIDGPNLAQRILGIDAGLSSSVGRAMAVMQLAKTGTRIAGSALKYGSKTGMALATGKSASERRIDNGNANMGERFGKYLNGKMSDDKINKGKNNEKGNESKKSVDKQGEKYSEKSGYKSTEFMNERSTHSDNRSDSAFRVDNATEERDTSFMNERSTHTDNRSESAFRVDNSTENSDIINKNISKSFGKFSNSDFKNEINRLKPDKSASIGERRDFNKQITNLIKGDHKAIKPGKNSRAEYKEINYQKALRLEKIYHQKKDRGDINGTK